MRPRSLLLFALLLSLPEARAGVLVYNGAAAITLDGTITNNPIIFRFTRDYHVRGKIVLANTARQVPFAGRFHGSGKYIARISTPDDITGKLVGTARLAKFRGTGILVIPGQGMGVLRYRPRQAVRGPDRFIGDYFYKIFRDPGNDAPIADFPVTRLAVKVTQTFAQFFQGLYTLTSNFEFKPSYAANYTTACESDSNGDFLLTGGVFYFRLKSDAVGAGNYRISLDHREKGDDAMRMDFSWSAEGRRHAAFCRNDINPH